MVLGMPTKKMTMTNAYTATLITRGVHLLATVHDGDLFLGVITVRRFARDVAPAQWADAALQTHLLGVPDLDVAVVALARAVTDAVRRRFWGANL